MGTPLGSGSSGDTDTPGRAASILMCRRPIEGARVENDGGEAD